MEHSLEATPHRISVRVTEGDTTHRYVYARYTGIWTAFRERRVRGRDGATYIGTDGINRPVPQWVKDIVAEVIAREEEL